MENIKDLNNMFFFAKVVDYGSYTAAASAMGMQTSKLSRRIVSLEEELGVRLLNRTSRKISLTEPGKMFYRHCVALVAEAQAAKAAIHQVLASPQGIVRLSCPLGLIDDCIDEVIIRFLGRYPNVRISLDATNRRVDVIDEGIDIAIRVRLPPLEDSDLAMRTLAKSKMVLVGSPDLLAKYGTPLEPSDLKDLPSVFMLSTNEKYAWHFFNKENKQISISHSPRLTTDDLGTLRNSAINSVGVAFLPEHFVRKEIENGKLVHLIPDWASPLGIVHAVFPSRRGMVPAVRALLDELVTGFKNIFEN